MNWFNKNIGILCATLVLLLIFLMPHVNFSDEQWYMARVQYIFKYGIGTTFILTDPAAPMHAIVHYLFSPITSLHLPQVRIVNFLMCVCICLLVYKMSKMEGIKVNINQPFLLFLLPGFFVLAFFAITEAPCLLFYTVSLYFLMKYVSSERKNLLFVCLSGAFLGLAVLTRQIFLVCLGPVCVMVFYRSIKYRVPAIIFFVLITVVCVAPVFYLWKGIVPPASALKYNPGASSLSIKHLFLSFGYAFFYCLIIIPGYFFDFLKKNLKTISLLVISGFIISIYIPDNNFPPMRGLLLHIFSADRVEIISVYFFKLIVMAGLIVIYFFLNELYMNFTDFKQVFYILSMLSILVTPILIHEGFSSRYSMQIAPLLVLFACSRVKPINGTIQFGINCIAIAINVIAIVTFLG